MDCIGFKVRHVPVRFKRRCALATFDIRRLSVVSEPFLTGTSYERRMARPHHMSINTVVPASTTKM